MPPGQAGACNEALMELGATVCTPANPRCLICPVAELCAAARNGTQAERPVMPVRKRTPHYDVAAGVIWQGEPFASQLLIAQRPQDGMLGGLWEFPGGKREADDASLAATLVREIDEELAIAIEVGAPITTVKHAYTHFRITLHAFHARHLQRRTPSHWLRRLALGDARRTGRVSFSRHGSEDHCCVEGRKHGKSRRGEQSRTG